MAPDGHLPPERQWVNQLSKEGKCLSVVANLTLIGSVGCTYQTLHSDSALSRAAKMVKLEMGLQDQPDLSECYQVANYYQRGSGLTSSATKVNIYQWWLTLYCSVVLVLWRIQIWIYQEPLKWQNCQHISKDIDLI